MENWKSQLVEWKEELLRTSGNDVLIHIPESSKKVISINFSDELTLPLDSKINSLFKETKEYEKQSGVNSLCIVHDVLCWSDGTKSYKSPLYLSEAFYELDKIISAVRITFSDNAFINPFLIKKIEQVFEVDIANLLVNELLPEEWQVENTSFLGNFHYHRFSLLKDVESYLSDADSENSLIGTFYNGGSDSFSLDKLQQQNYVLPTDEYQFEVLNQLANGKNLAVKGPPGSGKSQLIVNALFQHALEGRKVVLSSEKLAALNVIKDKLTTLNLGYFCEAIFNDAQEKTAFVNSLKATWLMLEEYKPESLLTTTFIENKNVLNQKLVRLNQLPELVSCHRKPLFELTHCPDVKTWKTLSPIVFDLNEKFKVIFEKTLSNSIVFYLKPSILSDIGKIEVFLKDAQLVSQLVETITNKLNTTIPLVTISDWKHLHRLTIHAQLITHDLFNRNREIFNTSSKEHKAFQKNAIQYKKLNEEINHSAQSELKKWRTIWSDSEIEEAIDAFSGNRWWTLRYRKWKSRFMSDYNPIVFSRNLAKNALITKQKINLKLEQLGKVKGRLIDFGISHPDSEISMVETLIIQYNQLDKNMLNTLHTYSSHTVQQLIGITHETTQINRFLSLNTVDADEIRLNFLLTAIEQESNFIKSNQNQLNQIVEKSIATFRTLKEVKHWEELDATIEYGQLMQFKYYNPELFHYTGTTFSSDITQLIVEEDKLCKLQTQQFIVQQQARFNAFHLLLNTPAGRLSEEEKQLKVAIRKGRSILVKEFGKTRQHLTIRELLESPAKHWINLLKPILLINPLSLSKILPNEKCSVDLLIMDEASQIPLVHAIPGIYRAKQVCVVGDPMQMPPSAYFTSGSREREDVLSKAIYHFESHTLRYHYRSQQAALIAFSNKYFYENALQVFPSATKNALDGLHSHYDSNGRYIERENVVEATKIVEWVNGNSNMLLQLESIAIVAFSESQLNAIQKIYFQTESHILLELVESGKLYFNTLENMQGDECDLLLISFGYGYDESTNFAMRFGPLNQLGGEKRLNVLFSRARKGIHLFHSVRASDFAPSDNLGVELMRKYLKSLEDTNSSESNVSLLSNLGFELQIDESTKTIQLANPYSTQNALTKLMTLYRLAAIRGWRIEINFKKDVFLE